MKQSGGKRNFKRHGGSHDGRGKRSFRQQGGGKRDFGNSGENRGDRGFGGQSGGGKRDFSGMRERAFRRVRVESQAMRSSRDNLVVQAVKSIDLIDKTSNLLVEQLRSWYGLYYPELEKQSKTNEIYLDKIAVEKTARQEGSLGADFPKQDIDAIVGFADKIRILLAERQEIEKYLDSVMKEIAPNLCAILGPIVGARMISTAGSLQKLASFPASTVQVIGAEKALFSHIRKGTPSPKHGVIYQHPQIRGAPKWAAGKIARRVAAKVSLAAKIDYFKGEFIGEKMADELEKSISGVLKTKAKE
ncbi:MAG: hypothetical protein V1911_03945 [Candidatus Micrarchaeota archaeon]